VKDYEIWTPNISFLHSELPL